MAVALLRSNLMICEGTGCAASQAHDIREALSAEIKRRGLDGEVRISGVRVGTVSDLDLDPKSYLATVHMNIRDGVAVPTDSALEVTSGGLLGNLYVAIFPGKAATMLPPGGMIVKGCGAEDVLSMIGRVGLSNGQSNCKR